VCLRVVGLPDGEYTTRDFGYSSSLYDIIYPLGLTEVETAAFPQAEFWCANVSYASVPTEDGIVRLYPIARYEDYEDVTDPYVSHETKSLMYTLGACYALDLSIFLLYLFNAITDRENPIPMLIPLSFLFICLCVFRICYMYMYPRGVFDGDPLSEYIVFEIPTFLLFSVVVISIAFWHILSKNKPIFFLEAKNTLKAIGIGLLFVWSLWVTVTIVYSEVILSNYPISFLEFFV
jgi:hypothetical protein